MLPTTDGSLGCARCSNISAMYVLSSSGGNLGRGSFSNNFTDFVVYAQRVRMPDLFSNEKCRQISACFVPKRYPKVSEGAQGLEKC